MMEILKHLTMKLKEEKGEVSVEWALVAVFMTVAIAAVFLPGVQAALGQAITTISNALTGA